MTKEVRAVKTLAVIVKLSDKEYYQVYLSDSEIDSVISFLEQLQDGTIKIFGTELEGIFIDKTK